MLDGRPRQVLVVWRKSHCASRTAGTWKKYPILQVPASRIFATEAGRIAGSQSVCCGLLPARYAFASWQDIMVPQADTEADGLRSVGTSGFGIGR